MSDLRDRCLHDLMADYVREHDLHIWVTDLSTWEDFRRATGVRKSASWLQREYLGFCTQPLDMHANATSGDLREGVHFTWCNDIREGLAAAGVNVRQNVDRLHQLMMSFDQAESSCNSGADSTVATSGDEGPSTQRPRSKKRVLSNHERYKQIRRNLDKLNIRRRSRLSKGK